MTQQISLKTLLLSVAFATYACPPVLAMEPEEHPEGYDAHPAAAGDAAAGGAAVGADADELPPYEALKWLEKMGHVIAPHYGEAPPYPAQQQPPIVQAVAPADAAMMTAEPESAAMAAAPEPVVDAEKEEKYAKIRAEAEAKLAALRAEEEVQIARREKQLAEKIQPAEIEIQRLEEAEKGIRKDAEYSRWRGEKVENGPQFVAARRAEVEHAEGQLLQINAKKERLQKFINQERESADFLKKVSADVQQGKEKEVKHRQQLEEEKVRQGKE